MQGWIGHIRTLRWLALTLLLGSSVTLAGKTGSPALDLGIARFALGTGDASTALLFTRNASSEHEYLVRARALLDLGHTNEADALLERLLAGDYYRGEAALLKSNLVQNPAEQKRLLELASSKGHGDIRQQALFRLAEKARRNDSPNRAGELLASMDEGYWAALGYMNIAADYAKTDPTPSRALISLRVAMAMAKADSDHQRGEALQAELRLRAGYLAYKHDDYAKAISLLEKIPLDSYSTPQALYLHGLAVAAQNKHRDAMQSWHRAKKYPLAFAGVAESWLGTGRGYDLAGYLGQAGEAYLAASATYESERVTLRKLADLVKQKGAYDAMVADTEDTRVEWFLADNRMLAQPRIAYALRFLEQPGAQASVQRVRRLKGLIMQMERHSATLKVFRQVLQERIGSRVALGDMDANHFKQRLEAVRARIGSVQESRQPDPQQAGELRQLTLLLADLEDSVNQFNGRAAQRDTRLGAYEKTVDRALERIKSNRARALVLLKEASGDLDERMLAFINGESERMLVALEKAEQQIAHLYEYLALQNLSRREP